MFREEKCDGETNAISKNIELLPSKKKKKEKRIQKCSAVARFNQLIKYSQQTERNISRIILRTKRKRTEMFYASIHIQTSLHDN